MHERANESTLSRFHNDFTGNLVLTISFTFAKFPFSHYDQLDKYSIKNHQEQRRKNCYINISFTRWKSMERWFDYLKKIFRYIYFYIYVNLLFCKMISKQYQNSININNFLIWKQNIKKIQILMIFYFICNINIIFSKNQFFSKL